MIDRVGILRPLRERDFALYWVARTTSWLGDGVMMVALPWQVYALTDSPTAMGVVAALQMVPIFAFTLFGGVASDRIDRRRVIVISDLVRGAAAGAVGVLALAGALELWHLGAMAVLFGLGLAFSGPAFGSIVPQLVPGELLVQANSTLFTFHTLALRLGGPALGGLVIAAFGTGVAFLIDAASFLGGAIAITLVAARPVERVSGDERPSILADIREGLGYVRARAWLWGTLGWSLIVLPLGTAPYVVLLPHLVKNDLGGTASELGLIFAAGGAGGVLTALALAQLRIPRRHVTFMYAMFAFGITDLFFYSLTQASWQAMAIAFVAEGALTGGIIVWNTLVQQAVPGELLGRVRSLDWFAAFALTPVAMAVVGPLAGAVGVRNVLAASGIAAASLTVLAFFLPGMRETEGRIVLSEPAVDSASP